jgi:hypothetical protein
MGVQNIGPNLLNDLFQSLCQRVDHVYLVQYRQARKYRTCPWSPVKMQTIYILLQHGAIALLQTRDMIGFPAKFSLVPQYIASAKCIAALQWNRMIKDVQYAHVSLQPIAKSSFLMAAWNISNDHRGALYSRRPDWWSDTNCSRKR